MTSLEDGLHADTNYRFRVRAVNQIGEGDISNKVDAKTHRKYTTPFAPENLSEAGKSQNSVTITFDPPSNIGGNSIEYYKIYIGQYDVPSGQFDELQ